MISGQNVKNSVSREEGMQLEEQENGRSISGQSCTEKKTKSKVYFKQINLFVSQKLCDVNSK